MSIELTSDEDFQTQVFDFTDPEKWTSRGTIPAIVDFHAPWCAPCKMLSPVLESVEKDFGGHLRVFKVNIDFLKKATEALGIQSIPSLLYLPVGRPIQGSMGAVSRTQLLKNIKEHLGLELPV